MPPHQTFVPSEARFNPIAQRFLCTLLHRSGQRRGGLLFGNACGNVLQVQIATRLGHGALQEVLAPDRGYALGVSDTLQALEYSDWDWCGNWLCHPHCCLGELEEDLIWVRRAMQRGLIDHQHPLVVVGWSEGKLQGRAYLPDPDAPLMLETLRPHLPLIQIS